MKTIGQIIVGCSLLLLFVLDGPINCADSQVCGIENCHGLNIECGPHIPEMCTEMYQLGDFCREFAQCGLVDNRCQLIPSKQFSTCKACVEQCNQETNPLKAFQCESDCRALFET